MTTKEIINSGSLGEVVKFEFTLLCTINYSTSSISDLALYPVKLKIRQLIFMC